MSNKFYELDKDGTKVYFNDEPLELINVVSRLNQLTYTKMKLKKELLVKRELCNAYEKKYHETNKANRLYRARIIELKKKLNDYELNDKEFDINYWKGIEKSYVDLLDKYHSRIVDSEASNDEFKVEDKRLCDVVSGLHDEIRLCHDKLHKQNKILSLQDEIIESYKEMVKVYDDDFY